MFGFAERGAVTDFRFDFLSLRVGEEMTATAARLSFLDDVVSTSASSAAVSAASTARLRDGVPMLLRRFDFSVAAAFLASSRASCSFKNCFVRSLTGLTGLSPEEREGAPEEAEPVEGGAVEVGVGVETTEGDAKATEAVPLAVELELEFEFEFEVEEAGPAPLGLELELVAVDSEGRTRDGVLESRSSALRLLVLDLLGDGEAEDSVEAVEGFSFALSFSPVLVLRLAVGEAAETAAEEAAWEEDVSLTGEGGGVITPSIILGKAAFLVFCMRPSLTLGEGARSPLEEREERSTSRYEEELVVVVSLEV